MFRHDSDEIVGNQTLEIRDSPFINFGDIKGPRNNSFRMKSVELVLDFNIFLAVHTTDADLNADHVYTTRATTSWQFNGSGTVTNGTGTPADGTWTGANASVRAPVTPRFSEVTNGNRAFDQNPDKSDIVNPHLP
ncbi:MAG: hypothetical protein N2C14_33260, partial [Planctomycetales bacterium]